MNSNHSRSIITWARRRWLACHRRGGSSRP
jgi:hypothetical protein